MTTALDIFADSVKTISNAYPAWKGPPAKLALQLAHLLGQDYIRRKPNKIREFVKAPLVKKYLARRNLQIDVNRFGQLEIRRL